MEAILRLASLVLPATAGSGFGGVARALPAMISDSPILASIVSVLVSMIMLYLTLLSFYRSTMLLLRLSYAVVKYSLLAYLVYFAFTAVSTGSAPSTKGISTAYHHVEPYLSSLLASSYSAATAASPLLDEDIFSKWIVGDKSTASRSKLKKGANTKAKTKQTKPKRVSQMTPAQRKQADKLFERKVNPAAQFLWQLAADRVRKLIKDVTDILG